MVAVANLSYGAPQTGGSPLHEAAWIGRDSAVGILLRFGADVHALDSVSARRSAHGRGQSMGQRTAGG